MLPNLSGLTAAAPTGTRPRTRARAQREKEALRMPEDVWQMVMEIANIGVDAPSDICRQVEERCLVANDSPFGPNACGAFGWTYDLANFQMGYYRHYSNWTRFQEWIAANPNVLADEDGTWKSSPRAYFRRCCNEWHAVVQQMEDGTYGPFRTDYYALPWSYAFLWEELRDHPNKFQLLPQGGECPYYLTLAREIMPQSPRQIMEVAGALRWRWANQAAVPYIHMAEQLETNAVPNHFVELAKLAVQTIGIALKHVPGSLHYNGDRTSFPPIPEYAELARIAVQQNGRALRYVPGTPDRWGQSQVAEPIPEYVELAKLAVKSIPVALQFVPGALMQVPGPDQVHVVRSPRGGVSEDDFVAIVKAGMETWSRETVTLVLPRHVPPHLHARCFS